jgi:hypothetical protein
MSKEDVERRISMSKEDVWRHHAEDWQNILKKNLILKVANLGVTTAILDVGDKESNLERCIGGMGDNRDVDDTYSELSASLTALVNLSKKVIDKHHNAFGEACQHLAVIRNAAEHRKPVALQEVKAFRKTVADQCKAAGTQLSNAPDVPHVVQTWTHFVQYIDQHGKGINALRHLINDCKQHTKVGELDQLKPAFMRLAKSCENAATIS